MPETVRLNKVLKELNISIDRAIDYLAEKGIAVDRRPTTKIDNDTYNILVEEFQTDAKQKAASEEVVLSKIPEPEVLEKPAVVKTEPPVEEEPKKEFIPNTVVEQEEKKESPQEPQVKAEEANSKPEAKEEPKVEEEPKEEIIRAKKEVSKIKTLGKIDLDTISKKNKPKRADTKEKPSTQTRPEEKPQKESPPKTEVTPKIKKSEASSEEAPEKIETQYKKLEGPNFTGKKVDLSVFQKKEKPKTDDKKKEQEKKKRKRIRKNVKFDSPRTPNRGRGRSNPRQAQPELTEEQVQEKIKETLEKLTNKGKNKAGARHRRDKRKERQAQEAAELEAVEKDKTLKVTEFVTVNELSNLMEVSVTEIISACMTLGVMVTLNQRLEAETIQLVADEFGYEAKFADAELEEELVEEKDAEEDLTERAPIVTVMGHVDHGKTSLLDYIRSANVIAGESGGITQHIGAYSVELENKNRITFLDTPGHEAFTAMRARGAQVTDLVIIVVAADDQIMPQTREAISHAQAADVPIIFAINKIDKPTANPEKVKEQLASMNLLVEDWGGSIQSQDISAKTGQNIPELLEKVLLEAEVLELKANPDRTASGAVVEASLEKGRGYVSTILVQNGTLKIGDYVLAGRNHGKVRALLDERGKNVKEVPPSTPVTILGLDGAPTAGDKFRVFTDEREAKQIASKRDQLQRDQSQRAKDKTRVTLGDIGRRRELGDYNVLNIILKGDVDGSVEALSDSLQKLSTETIDVNILHKGVGPITESDVLLASASEAIVIGFNVRPGNTAREIADKEQIEIRTYSIIYDAINEVKDAMVGMLAPQFKEEVTGNVEIRETFKISKIGTIAGCMVLDGKITRNSKVRLIREGVVIHDGELESLKRFKDDVKEVTKGYECGLNIKNFNQIMSGDIIEAYHSVEIKPNL